MASLNLDLEIPSFETSSFDDDGELSWPLATDNSIIEAVKRSKGSDRITDWNCLECVCCGVLVIVAKRIRYNVTLHGQKSL